MVLGLILSHQSSQTHRFFMAQMERPSHRTAAKTASKKWGNWNMEKAWYPLAFCKVKGKRKIGQYQSCKRGQLNSCGQSSCKCTRMLQLVKATLTCDFNSAPVVSFPEMGEEDCKTSAQSTFQAGWSWQAERIEFVAQNFSIQEFPDWYPCSSTVP